MASEYFVRWRRCLGHGICHFECYKGEKHLLKTLTQLLFLYNKITNESRPLQARHTFVIVLSCFSSCFLRSLVRLDFQMFQHHEIRQVYGLQVCFEFPANVYKFGYILDMINQIWAPFGHMLATFGHLLDTFFVWTGFGHPLVTFWSLFKKI